MAPADRFLNEATRKMLARVARASMPPLHQLPLAQARASYVLGVGAMEGERVPVPRVDNFTIPGPAGGIPARLWAPSADPGLPVLLYLHGGGFVVGGIDTCEGMCRRIAQQSGAAVVAIDYRLAPEHPFPAGLDDAFAALQWLAANAVSLGLDPARLAVGGDSAGGTLGASVALMARDVGLSLALQVLFYPSVEPSVVTESYRLFSKDLMLDDDLMRWFEAQARGPGFQSDWRREPMLAASHQGLAPAWIGLAECDALTDEGRKYAEVLRQAGVPVELVVWPGVIHDFINMGRFVPEAFQAHAAVAQALKQAFGG